MISGKYFIFLSAALIAACFNNPAPVVENEPSGRTLTYQVDHQGRQRQFLLFVPATQKSYRFPLVIMLHGSGSTARAIMKETGWNSLAVQEDFLVAYPEGARPNPEMEPDIKKNPQNWNDGSGRGFAGESNIDDSGFIKEVILKVKKEFRIEEKQIFIAGFSNGASMAQRAGLELGDKIAAVGAVGGHLRMKERKAKKVPSVMYIMGLADPVNPEFGGRIVLPYGLVSYNPPFTDSLNSWKEILKCDDRGQTVRPQRGWTGILWKGEGDLLYYRVSGLTHVWPGGSRDKKGYRATPLIWQFFKEHSFHE